MSGNFRTRITQGLLAVAALWAVSCGGPTDETVISDLDKRETELRSQVDELKNALRDLDDQMQQLKDDLNRTKSFIPKPGTAGADLPGQVNALTVEVENLKKSLGQGGAAPKAAEASKAKAAAAPEAAGPGAAVPAETAGGAGKKAASGAKKAKAAAGASAPAAGEVKAATEPKATPAPAPAPAPRVSGGAAGGQYYTVKSGDTLEGIAKAKGVSAQQLRAENHLSADQSPEVGMRIWIPGGK
ncbi:MAG: LysM peptidoglycan-binding domain-containing protein [Candidatus Sumerlaeota bacterium]|nr:LysM peptidoglycan-binding domain-containing protein [Candidatus Sumerlaeota bacterium]